MILVYGKDWCEDTKAARTQLEQMGLRYEYINIEEHREAAEWVRRVNGGKQRTPTLDIEGTILIEPDHEELLGAIEATGARLALV